MILKSNWRDTTIILFDIVNIYPSIKFDVDKNAVNYFAKDLSNKDKMTTEACLKMI